MPSSAVRTFSDPDAYAAAILGTNAELTVTERGHFTTKLIRVDLHRLRVQRYAENLPRILHSANMTGRATISFRTEPGPSLLAGGLEVEPFTIVQHPEGHNYFQQSSGPTCFGTMSFPVEDMASIGVMTAGCDLTPPKDPLIRIPPRSAMARLQRLHAAVGDLAEKVPEILANPDAAHGIEQVLIEAMVDCLAHREGRENSFAQTHHAIVMRRFHRVVEENVEEPLFIPEICNAIRVPDRTLRLCCQEHLGMGPKRYLLLRRMHLARRALRQAEPATTSVTDIATRYGFWQLGRFAVEYQALYGEPPSATLSRQSH